MESTPLPSRIEGTFHLDATAETGDDALPAQATAAMYIPTVGIEVSQDAVWPVLFDVQADLSARDSSKDSENTDGFDVWLRLGQEAMEVECGVGDPFPKGAIADRVVSLARAKASEKGLDGVEAFSNGKWIESLRASAEHALVAAALEREVRTDAHARARDEREIPLALQSVGYPDCPSETGFDGFPRLDLDCMLSINSFRMDADLKWLFRFSFSAKAAVDGVFPCMREAEGAVHGDEVAVLTSHLVGIAVDALSEACYESGFIPPEDLLADLACGVVYAMF